MGLSRMHNLGVTRSALAPDHLLQTPDTFVRTPVPGLTKGSAVVHTGAASGATFAQLSVELQAGGTFASNGHQRFLYVLEGEIQLALEPGPKSLTPGSFAYLPPRAAHRISSTGTATFVVIERAPNGSAHSEPDLLIGHEQHVPGTPLMGDPDLQVRTLLPEHPGLNFAVNTMTYQPGAALAQVEVHIMEHGLLMLEGGGIYRLGDRWYPVTAGDFIWMAPFCPQWFGALGKTPAKYLVYKDWNQHPLA